MTKIALLHTADAHVQSFAELLSGIDPTIEQDHKVHADWLSEARESGLTEDLRRRVRAFLTDQAKSADAVALPPAPRLGPIVDELAANRDKVLRVDRPLMQTAADHEGTIVVALCLESTLTPTLALLRDAFVARDKGLHHRVVLCKEEWVLFEAGDRDAFGQAIAAKVKALVETVDDCGCVVLAQASMAVAEPYLADLAVAVYASPRLAAEAVVRAAHANDQG